MASLQKEYKTEKLTGQVYTPPPIVCQILDEVGYYGKDILGKKILEPSCGDGQFLIEIAKRIIAVSPIQDLQKNLECITAWDTDNHAIQTAIARLNDLIQSYNITVHWNIKVQDALAMVSNNTKYDYIVGNPPYIRIQHLDESTRNFIQSKFSFCKNGSTDIYIAFFELAYKLLTKKGTAGYITPNSFLRTATAKSMRAYFVKHKAIKKIINFGTIQVFDNVSTYCAITIFNKGGNPNVQTAIAETLNQYRTDTLDYTHFHGENFWSLEKTNAGSGKKLKDIADIFVGLATLCDKYYVAPYTDLNNGYITLHTKHSGNVKIEKAIVRPVIKASKYKNHNQKINEVIIYPYTVKNDVATLIPEKTMKQDFPLTYAYLLSIKDILDKRDAGRPNSVGWYAYGRSQALTKCFGKKIIFSPMSDKPRFMVCDDENALIYSGYGIRYDGDLYDLSKKLSSSEMEDYVTKLGTDFRGGWKGYSKTIIQEFILEI